MGEQLIAVLIGTRNGGSFAVKGQGRKVIGKAAEIGSAAVGIRFDCIFAVNITCHHRGQLLKSSFGIVLAHESGTIIQPCLLIFVRQNYRPQLLIAACQVVQQLCSGSCVFIRRCGCRFGNNRACSALRRSACSRRHRGCRRAAATGQQRDRQSQYGHHTQNFFHHTHGKSPPEKSFDFVISVH